MIAEIFYPTFFNITNSDANFVVFGIISSLAILATIVLLIAYLNSRGDDK